MAYDEPITGGYRPPPRRAGARRPLRRRPPLVQALRGAVEAQPEQSDPYSYEADPILQRIRALAGMRRADAEAEAQRLRSQLDIEYGEGAAGAANPFSVQAKLREARAKEPKALLESLNEANLYYSGARTTREADLYKDLLERETGAQGAYRSARGEIEGGLRQALLGAQEEEIGAEEEAAARLQERLGELPIGPASIRPRVAAAVRGVRPRSALAGALRRPLPRPRPRLVRGRLPE